MTDQELHWLAGFLEGEGSFVFHQTATGRQFTVQAVSVDDDVMERVARLLGARKNGPYWSAKSTKPFWRVQMSRRSDVLALAAQLRPLMGDRRKAQIDNLFKMSEAHPPRLRGPRR